MDPSLVLRAPSPPAMYDNRRVQRPLVQVMCVHLLDEAQQVARAVRQAPAGKGQVGTRPGVMQTPTESPLTHHPHHHPWQAVNAQLRPSREVEVHKRPLEALISELQAQHSLHVCFGGANTA